MIDTKEELTISELADELEASIAVLREAKQGVIEAHARLTDANTVQAEALNKFEILKGLLSKKLDGLVTGEGK